MDKSTLSQYGWVIIVIIVLAILIGLATPFGNFVKESVDNTIHSFGDKIVTSLEDDDDDGDKVVWTGTLENFVYNDDIEGYVTTYNEEFPNIPTGYYKLKISNNIIDCYALNEDGSIGIISQGNPKIYLAFNSAEGWIVSFFPIEGSITIEIMQSDDVIRHAVFIEGFTDDGRSGHISAKFCNDIFAYEETESFEFEMRDSKGELIYTPSWNTYLSYLDDRALYRYSDNGIDEEVYEAIQNSIDKNEPITLTFTQTLKTGRVISITVKGVPTVRTDLINYEGETYYCWGNTDAFIMGE